MIARNATILGVVLGFALSLTAHAEKYLVQFKSPQTFEMMAQSMKAQAFNSQQLGMAEVAPMRLFNSNTSVNEVLEHVQLLIIESSDAAAIESLRQHPAIALVEKEIMHPAPKVMATFSVAKPKKPKKPKLKMDRPWGIDSVKAPGAWTTTKGDTARVMVLDTGLDSDHPALKGQLEAGKNFTGGSSTDISDEIGHGTHVAGTILAAGVRDGLTGVAPKAKLLMGKVCTSLGCPSTAIAAGINWAAGQKVDVVNMSLGGMMISAGERAAIAACEAAGVFITAASGNDGTGKVSFPAAVETLTAVGAIDVTNAKAVFSQWGPELDVMGPGVDVISSVPRGTGRGATVRLDTGKGLTVVKALPFVGSPVRIVEGDLVFAGLGKPADVATLNLTGKVALISRGEIPFKEKVANVLAKGAIGAVIYNNAPGLLQGTLSEDGTEAAIPAVMIEQTLGEEAKATLAGGGSASTSFAVEATDYASFQGTSMATPHVAGVAALIRAANKRLTPLQVREILKSTATALGPNPNNEFGSGLVNADAAVQKALVSAPVFQLAN